MRSEAKPWEIGMALCEPGGLDEATRDRLWGLYSPHHHVDRASFEGRWRGLDQLAIFTHVGEIVGMIGVRLRPLEIEGERIETIYFGQVFIRPDFRGKLLIQRLLIQLFLSMKLKGESSKIIFWTDALTYKPYLVMTHYLKEYYPNAHRDAPAWVAPLILELGRHYYGELFDASSGTVMKPSRQIREGVADITARELSDPDVRYYASRNPRHGEGHGLLIMCPCTLSNVFHFLRVISRRAMVKAPMRREVPARS